MSDAKVADAPAPQPVIATRQAATDEFGKVQDERTAIGQKNALFFDAYMKAARASLAQQDFKAAEQSVLQALQLRRDDPAANELFKQVMGLEGISLGSLEETTAMVANRRQLARQQQQVLAQEHFTKATHLDANAEHDKARIELETAQLVMRFDPYETDFGQLKPEVDEMLAMTLKKLDAQNKSKDSDAFKAAYEAMVSKDAKDRRNADSQVQNLLIGALESFQRGDFDNSEISANKVLRLQPGNMKAKEIVEASQRAKHSQWREQIARAKHDQFERWLLDTRAKQIPTTSVLVWPDHDQKMKIDRRADRDALVDAQVVDSEAMKAIRAKLENDSITLDFGDKSQTFNETIKHIRGITGINIVVKPEVAKEKGEEAVNVTLLNYRLGGALKIILENMKLGYVVRDDVLYITTIEDSMGKTVPSIYDVRDLTVSLPNFKAPNLNLRPGGAGEAAVKQFWGEELERYQETDLARLRDLVAENVGVGTWELPEHSLTPTAGQLVANTTPAVHRDIRKFLDDLRKFNKLTVHVEARFLSVDKAFLADVGFDFRGGGGNTPGPLALLDDVTNGAPNNAGNGVDNGSPGGSAASSLHPTAGLFYNDATTGDFRGRTENLNRPSGTLLNNTGGATVSLAILGNPLKINGLLRAVEKNLDQTLVNAPRLTIYNRQRANLSIVNQISYVKDYDVEVAQTAFIADPLVDIVQDGLTLDVKPTVSYDRKSVTLELQPTVATLIRPIRTFESTLSGLTTPVVIELPELVTRTAQTTVTVPDQGFVVIGGLTHVSTIDRRAETPILSQIPILSFFFSQKTRSDEIRDLIIILHVKIVDLSEEEKNLDR